MLVHFGDGTMGQFSGDIQFQDMKFANGRIVRYFRNGSFEVLREAVQTIQIVSGWGGFTEIFTD